MIVQTIAMLQSFALAALAFIGQPAGPRRSTASPLSAAWPSRSTTRPAGRSSSRWCPTDDMHERGQPEQRAHDRARGSSARRSPGCWSPPSASAGAFLLDGLSYIAVLIGLWMMRTDRAAPAPVTPKAKGQVRAGPALRPERARAVGPAGDDGDRRHAGVQLPGRVPAVRHPRPRRRRRTFTLLFSVVSVGSLIGALATARRKTVSSPHRRARLPLASAWRCSP